MAKFVIKNIEGINGKQQFKQLIILKDNEDSIKIQREISTKEMNGQEINYEGVFDIYENNLEDRYKGSLNSIMAIMNRIANNQIVAKNKFKDVTPQKESINEYEFKCGDLRVFAIKIFSGKLVLLGGYKNSQSADFSRFRSLKKQYLESIKIPTKK